MALFHFRIKSYKKPDGSKISAVKHVDYIRREGAFSDFDRSTSIDHFSGNLISSAGIKDACGGLASLLYITDDFGCIKNSSYGIELSDNSSPTTISIALLLADKVMNHQPLIISGSDDFKKSVINAAISDDLPISFADPLLQNLFIHHKELFENERNSFISNGSTLVTHRLYPQPFITPFNRQSIESVAKIGLRLPTLSQLPLVHSQSQRTDLLLISAAVVSFRIIFYPNGLTTTLRNFSSIRQEKKTVVTRLLMKSFIAALQNRANGATILLFLYFALTLLISKMTF